tara:strand:+ start:515 stop:1081 length:567 start_codon:yes stop_codon:yes gene_type:complete
MRPKPALSAFMMLAILLASSMGCIGLVPAREFMEDLREPPKLEDRIERINASHVFTTDLTDVQGSTSYSTVQSFEVDSNVIEISAYISAAMPLELILPGIPTDVRYVRATLFDADGNQVWFEEVTETERKMVATFQQPLAEGTWSLDVEARGYGEEVANLYKDSFQVLVKIERQCWEYPNEEDVCAYD